MRGEMNRRTFLSRAAASVLIAAGPAGLLAQARFRPTRFSVQVRGRGRDVILIPGLTAGRRTWDAAVRAVPGYRYHLVQVAGFAGDPAGGNAEGRVLAPLAEQLSRYIESAGLDRPAIVGHSLGGTLGLMVAARYPARVGRLMVVDMLPRPTAMYGGAAGANTAAMLGGWIDNPLARRAIAGLISAFSPPDEGGGSDPDVVARALHDMGAVDLTAELPRIRAPLTILYALSDPARRETTDAAFRTGYRGARGARLIRVDNSGHQIMADQPQRFARHLADFLR